MLTFVWGNQIKRLVRSEEALDFGGGEVFDPLPEVEPNNLVLAGGARIESLKIDAPDWIEPFASLAGNEPMARVACSYEFVDPGDLATRKLVFFGRSGMVEPTEGDDTALYSFEFRGLKEYLSSKVGLRCTDRCQWWLSHPLCSVPVTNEAATVAAVNTDGLSTRITLTFPGPTPDLTSARYRTGAIIRDGLPIMVVDSLEDGRFEMAEPLPTSWLGQTVELRNGCDGLLETCRDEYDNELEISIYGRHMPDRFMLSEAP